MAPSSLYSSKFDSSARRRAAAAAASKKLIGGLLLASAILASASCFLILLYVSYTAIFYTAKHGRFNRPGSPELDSNTPVVTFRSRERQFFLEDDVGGFPPTNSSEDFLLDLPRRMGELGQQDSGDGGGGDRVGRGSGNLSSPVSVIHQLSSQSDSSELEDSRARSSSSEDGSIQSGVFHDEHIFLKSYQEMNTTLKIYVYPHNHNEPFANVLLPGKSEPSGNYASEMYFKNTLMKSHFITSDPSKADFFFLPFSIASMRHDKRIGVAGLANFVKDYVNNAINQYPYWNRTGGADHFYVACHSIGRLALSEADFVKSNAIQVVCSSSYFLPNYFSHKDVSLPQVWPRHEKLDLTSSKRKKLAFFAGAMNSPVRKILYSKWKGDPDIFVYNGRLPTPYSKQLLGSKYCLHVKGFEVNTARLGDAMYYGCVPVIIADHYDLPYMDILNWESFSVVVKVDDIPKLKNILQGITSEEYARLQSNVLRARKHFQWNMFPDDYDAFYMVMFELWLRRGSVRLAI